MLCTAQFEHTASNVHACAAVGVAVCCACVLGVMCHIHIDRYMWAVVMINVGLSKIKYTIEMTSLQALAISHQAHHTEMHLVQHISMYPCTKYMEIYICSWYCLLIN